MKLTAEQRGYIAGIIDGEGCLYLNPRNGKDGAYPVLNIANTDQSLLIYIQSLIGGSIHRVKKQGGWKDCYILMCHSSVLRELLPQIVSLLIIKKLQATLVMRWLSLFNNYGPKRKLGNERAEIQYIFRNCIKLLNQRGICKADEFRGTLDKETILSQALQEIEGKVQRLEAEAKDIDNQKVEDIIKKHGPVSKKELSKMISSRYRNDIDNIIPFLPVISYKERISGSNNSTTFYIHASNASTSVRPERDDIVRATQ